MLDRPPSRSDRRRQQWREVKRRQRQRERDGRTTVTIEVGEEIISLLVRTEWLREAEAADRTLIAKAIERLLQATAAQR